MTATAIDIIEQIATNGTAPEEGCRLFGVGYDDVFDRLTSKYLHDRFGRGLSDEKFVVGPFGSGKTHFLRQLMEIARERGCVTAEVTLNKDVDFTDSLIVYSEVARELVIPSEQRMRGIPALLEAMLHHVRSRVGTPAREDRIVDAWVRGVDKAPFEDRMFGVVLRRTLGAYLGHDEATYEAGCRWLEGRVSDREIAKQLGLAPLARAEQNLHARRAMFSLFQFVRYAGLPGTVVAFDEAEQGLRDNKAKRERILSMLQSGINQVNKVKEASALIVYAFTPDLAEEMEKFAALQQRVADPGPGLGFFDGNTLAPRIDLQWREPPVDGLRQIGHRLVDLLYDAEGASLTVDKASTIAAVGQIAEEVAESDISSTNRRLMAKRTCALLAQVREQGRLVDTSNVRLDDAEEDEV